MESRLPASAPILVAGMQDPRTVPSYRGPLGVVADRHARRLNAALRELVVRRGRPIFAGPAAPKDELDRRFRSPLTYSGWAASLADALVPALSPTTAGNGTDAATWRTSAESKPETNYTVDGGYTAQ